MSATVPVTAALAAIVDERKRRAGDCDTIARLDRLTDELSY
jgi:hypothetical protein